MKQPPMRNPAYFDPLPNTTTQHYHDIFVASHHEEHTYAQLTHIYGEHELLAFVVLSTPRFDKKLQLSLIIPRNKLGGINIVGTISDNESPEMVGPFIIPEQVSALRNDAFEKVAHLVAEAIKIIVDKHLFESMDRRFKAIMGHKFRALIAQLVKDDNLRIVSVLGIEDIVARLDAVPVLASRTLDSLYDRIKDDYIGKGSVSLSTTHTGGDTSTTVKTLSFSPENSAKVFIITEQSDKYATIEYYNSRGIYPTATTSPRIVRLKLDEPSESYCGGETTIVEHKYNLSPDELLVLMYSLYPTSKFLADICDRIND